MKPKKKASRRKAAPLAPLAPPRSKIATVIVYSRPSGYWYAQARDATTGAQITDASGYSRENVLHELRGKFAMIGVAIKSVRDEDPYAASGHATKKKSRAQLQREIDEVLAHPSPEIVAQEQYRPTHQITWRGETFDVAATPSMRFFPPQGGTQVPAYTRDEWIMVSTAKWTTDDHGNWYLSGRRVHPQVSRVQRRMHATKKVAGFAQPASRQPGYQIVSVPLLKGPRSIGPSGLDSPRERNESVVFATRAEAEAYLPAVKRFAADFGREAVIKEVW